MKDTFIICVLKAYFNMEISNKVIFGINEIIVDLENGTKARITARLISR